VQFFKNCSMIYIKNILGSTLNLFLQRNRYKILKYKLCSRVLWNDEGFLIVCCFCLTHKWHTETNYKLSACIYKILQMLKYFAIKISIENHKKRCIDYLFCLFYTNCIFALFIVVLISNNKHATRITGWLQKVFF